ncbi:MAG: YlbF family regulator [Longimicrobiales bacterium]
MAGIYEMAKELGGALARTDEYQTLKRVSEAVDDNRELVELRNKLQALEERIEASLRAGQQPEDEVKKAYEDAATELQGKAEFQRLIAAQSNFEKVMYKVNETMAKGLQEGATSKIILSS